jgi:hypothetical protein
MHDVPASAPHVSVPASGGGPTPPSGGPQAPSTHDPLMQSLPISQRRPSGQRFGQVVTSPPQSVSVSLPLAVPSLQSMSDPHVSSNVPQVAP